jgi:hypothetical protein
MILLCMGYSQGEIHALIRSILAEPNDTLFLSETPTSSYFEMVWEAKPSDSEVTYKPDMKVSKVRQGNTSTT